MKKIFAILALLLLQISLFAQIDAAKFSQLCNALDTHQKGMLSMCVSENGNVTYASSIGYADIEIFCLFTYLGDDLFYFLICYSLPLF